MAMAYIQNATTMINMPVNMVDAIVDPFIETDAPWCNVFHHLTEK